MNKAFCIGFHKTGTTSLGVALEELGYNVCGVRHDLIPSLQKNDMSEVIAVVKSHDAFRDNPWPVIFKELDVLFPGSKFILTIREENKWIKSAVNHFQRTPSDMRLFIYGKAFPVGNEEIYLNRYRKHNEAVVEYFKNRASDLLILNLEHENPWIQLCKFLDKPIPGRPFPLINKGAYSPLSRLKKQAPRILRGLKRRLGI
ncbi:MAG TPA: sulfotransferase [Saprospiraceae bacterium]|nr:sulfotransferase [Saprospiraceae bacterium]